MTDKYYFIEQFLSLPKINTDGQKIYIARISLIIISWRTSIITPVNSRSVVTIENWSGYKNIRIANFGYSISEFLISGD